MNGEKEILLNIYSKVEELEQEILEYKKSLHENLIVNK